MNWLKKIFGGVELSPRCQVKYGFNGKVSNIEVPQAQWQRAERIVNILHTKGK